MKLLLAIALAALGCKSSAEKVCQRAAERYEQCMTEVLGAGVKDLVHDPLGTGVAVCAKSDKTVAMYRECLDKPTCTAFDECMDSYVERTLPKVDPSLPRAAQCEQYVTISQRGLVFEILFESGGAGDAEKRKVIACLSADEVDAKTCLEGDAVAQLAEKSKQLREECNAWSAEVAACKLKLPGAACVDGGDEPAPKPPELGTAGPAVAWSMPLVKDDALVRDRPMLWTADGTLAILDHKALRALRDGKERWKVATDVESTSDVATVGTRLFLGDRDALRVFDVASGAEAETPLHGFIFAVQAAGNRALVRQADDAYEVACTAARCTATKLAHIGDDFFGASLLATAKDGIVVGSSDEQVLFDRRGKPRVHIKLDTGRLNQVVLTSDGVAIGDDDGVALLSLAACAKLGPTLYLPSVGSLDDGSGEIPDSCEGCKLVTGACVAAHAKGEPRNLVALPGGGVAYNDDETEPHTHVLARDHKWSTPTDATGGIAADDDSVYAVSHVGYDGPAEVIALDRETGAPRWHTTLPGVTGPVSASLAVRDGHLAVIANDTVYVLQVPPIKHRT